MINCKKGIVLSGGTGSRLYPLTRVVNKQLLPIFDKPMIYYSISTLINFGIKDLCIVSSEDFLPYYERLLSNASDFGLNISFRLQKVPNGIAECFLICEDFIKNENVSLILGDNIFHSLPKIKTIKSGATIFAYKVEDPERYGVVQFSKKGKAISIEEKPENPKSSYAIPGLYFYDKNVVKYTKSLRPSKRGELEITDLNKIYLSKGNLNVIKLNRGVAWLDAGTPNSLSQSANYVQAIQERQGIKIGCIEEDCLNNRFINNKDFLSALKKFPDGEYKKYLQNILKSTAPTLKG